MLEMLTTFDEKAYLEGIREEGLEDGLIKGRAEGREEGLKKGRTEGRAEGREEIIIGAYKNGNSAEQIAVFNGLPLSEVQQIVDSYEGAEKR